MKISIAMATYNGAKYLEEQLRSIANQTRLPDELVITDDCSNDGTREIIERFADKVPFEVTFSQNVENLGYTGNFNEALLKTSGDLVLLCDQDDVWFPEKIARLETLAASNPDMLVVMNDAAVTDENLNESGVTKYGQMKFISPNGRGFVMGCCGAIRKEMLDICLPIPKEYEHHDTWIMFLAHDLSRKLISDEVLQYHRRHGKNASISITNATTPLSSGRMYWRKIKRMTRSLKRQNYGNDKLEKMKLHKRCVDQILQRYEGEYRSSLQELSDKLKARIEREKVQLHFFNIRKEIRARPMLRRGVTVVRHLKKGEYKKASGLRSAVRDLIG